MRKAKRHAGRIVCYVYQEPKWLGDNLGYSVECVRAGYSDGTQRYWFKDTPGYSSAKQRAMAERRADES